MKKLFTIALLFIAATATAQDIKKIEFTVDTISYGNLSAPLMRAKEGELDKLLAIGGKNFAFASPLMKLEKELNDAEAYLKAGKKQITWMQHSHDLVNEIKKANAKFGVSEYEQEIKLYEAYNGKLVAHEKENYANADKVKRTTMKQIEKESQDAENKRLALQRKQDSTKHAYDSLSKLALVRESKAREEFCIKKYGKEKGELIANGKVAVGMNKEMCLAAWGEPTGKKETEKEGVKIEILNFGPSAWLKFQNDELVGMSGEK